MKSLNLYKQKFEKFGVDSRSLQWKTKGAAHQRFRQFWSEIDFDNKSVLDIGCGFGEMGNFLTKRYKNVVYKGVDIMPEFIESGKKLYPQLTLETEDFFTQTKPINSNSKFDVLICSGALNSNFGDKQENIEFRKNAIKRMFDDTANICAFNMSGGHPAKENSIENNIWYADSLEILEYCMSLTRRVILKQNYHPTDFTIFMYKAKTNKRC